jgi:hypothetical protein
MGVRYTLRKQRLGDVAESLDAEFAAEDEALYKPRYNVAPADVAWGAPAGCRQAVLYGRSVRASNPWCSSTGIHRMGGPVGGYGRQYRHEQVPKALADGTRLNALSPRPSADGDFKIQPPVRLLAVARACLERAADDTIRCPSRLSFSVIARERPGFGAVPGCFPRLRSRFACSRASSEVAPFGGGGRFTPARRALASPMAMACSVERAPCFPARMCSISS